MSALKPGGVGPTEVIDSVQVTTLPVAPVLLAVPGKAITPALHPVHFCGEEVPLHEASVTRRWINMLLKQSAERSYLYQLRLKAARVFPVIEPILAKYGIPRDFKYLPLAESALVGHAVSPKGASGYWQLMPQTARDHGLTVNDQIDERLSLERSTVAACRYIRSLYKELGSWTLVAAAYNSGSAHILHHMQRQGGERNYYSLRLYRETRQYLYRVLAHKELLTRPRLYNDLLQPDVLAYLTFPIQKERRHKNPKLTPKQPLQPDTADLEPDSNWGPRNRNLLEEELALVEDMQSGGGRPEGDSALTSPVQPQAAMLGLMGIRVLRFRRRYLYEMFLAAKRKVTPLFDWGWV